MQAGFSGQGAVMAAELARRGIIGSKEILEGRYGLFRTYVRTNAPDWEAIAGGLGTRFPLLDTHGFKVWPACGYTRPVNAAVLQLREEYGMRPGEVEAIDVVGGTRATQLLSEPLERKRRPQIAIDGKYSIPFTTAVMMVKGNVRLLDYTDEGLRDPAVLAMADRVSYRAEAEFPDVVGGSSSVSRPTVEIRTKDGTIRSCQVQHLPGDPKQPVEWEFLEAKFRDCLAFSEKPVTREQVERAIRAIRELEQSPDVTEIVRLLS
jgi:2-methylcitrate dehydratase PrpD